MYAAIDAKVTDPTLREDRRTTDSVEHFEVKPHQTDYSYVLLLLASHGIFRTESGRTPLFDIEKLDSKFGRL